MALPTGVRLGPYEVLGPLGSGGMGEVYRAKDPRLAREVAIKVLPTAFSSDPDRLRRFEQEARAAGLLNHPNVMAIYDLGVHEGAPYVVCELLEGETLRSELAGGPLTPRRALDYAAQMAQGLAAAHGKGIVHRDLKPENVFVTREGRIKILDFGLAKLTHPEEGGEKTDLPTATAGTEPGVVLGTLGYMSPEQVRGKPADQRSDIFAFGAILYEMLSGKRAFHGDSAADTMSAILREDPPELSETNRTVSPAIDRLIRHCLEKNPERRFHSAADLAFDLESLTGVSAPAGPAAAEPAPARGRRLWVPVAALLLAAGLLSAGWYLGRRGGASGPPVFRQLTFRRGQATSARFTDDGQTVVFGAAWEGKPPELFMTRIGTPESRPLGIPRAGRVVGVVSGELAVTNGPPWNRTLSRVPLAGGAPREVATRINDADLAPDGKSFAIAVEREGRSTLEYPIGTKLYESASGLSTPRISPDGERVAFLEHPILQDDRGFVAVVDRKGTRIVLTPEFASTSGLAWHPNGKEIWFTAAEVGSQNALHAVGFSGKSRVIVRAPGRFAIHDVAKDGRLLVSNNRTRSAIRFRGPGDTTERDLSWLDYSILRGLTPDGRQLLFDEEGEGGGHNYGVYLRPTDGSPAVRLGAGRALGISPDGAWVLTISPDANDRIVLLPTGAGEPKKLPATGIRYSFAFWHPNGRELIVAGNRPGEAVRLFVHPLEGGSPRALGPSSLGGPPAISRDGRLIIAQDEKGVAQVYSLDGKEPPRPLPAVDREDVLVAWSADGEWLYALRQGIPSTVERIHLLTGRRERWKEFPLPDPAGVRSVSWVVFSADLTAYAYGYTQTLSDLYAVDGAR